MWTCLFVDFRLLLAIKYSWKERGGVLDGDHKKPDFVYKLNQLFYLVHLECKL